jgi:hypothetical protein
MKPMFGTPGQIKATKTLLKFCREHDHTPFWISQLEKCLKHLEENDQQNFFQAFKPFTHAGMGCFTDWYPPRVFAHEDDEYLETLFWALVDHWRANVSLAEKSS